MMTLIDILVIGLTRVIAEARPLPSIILPRAQSSGEASVSTFKEEQGIHQAVTLAATILLFILHRAVKNGGFTIGHRFRSTDLQLSWGIGLISSLWTGVVIASGFLSGSKPCTVSTFKCFARLAYAPWILQLTFFFWVIAYVNELSNLKSEEKARVQPRQDKMPSKESGEKYLSPSFDCGKLRLKRQSFSSLRSPTTNSHNSRDPEIDDLPWYKQPFWQMDSTQGPTNWSTSINPGLLYVLYLLMMGINVLVAAGALAEYLWTLGLLCMVSVAVFATGAAGPNGYDQVPHKYRAQTLRVVLKTDHLEGTTYVIPCRDRGFDAVWGPKIAYEHREVDAIYTDARQSTEDDTKRKKSRLKNLRKLLASFNGVTTLSKSEVEDLASWIYETAIFFHTNGHFHMADVLKGATNEKMWSIACKRKVQQLEKGQDPVNIHLVSYSLMYALWHAEYLVFMHQEAVKDSYLPKFALLRNPRSSGLPLNTKLAQIGALSENFSHYESFQEAIRYVYALFGLFQECEVDQFLRPECVNIKLPEQSVVVEDEEMKDIKEKFDRAADDKDTASLKKRKMEQLERYVGKLWEKCIVEEESTFAALHAFSVYWLDDIGMDANKGWHGFPLISFNRKGDLFSWFVIWRQVWYMAIISEFLHVSPIITSAFISGILQ